MTYKSVIHRNQRNPEATPFFRAVMWVLALAGMVMIFWR